MLEIITEIIKVHKKEEVRIWLTNCDTPWMFLRGMGSGLGQGVKYVLILCLTITPNLFMVISFTTKIVHYLTTQMMESFVILVRCSNFSKKIIAISSLKEMAYIIHNNVILWIKYLWTSLH
jgi:hypothetical protein